MLGVLDFGVGDLDFGCGVGLLGNGILTAASAGELRGEDSGSASSSTYDGCSSSTTPSSPSSG